MTSARGCGIARSEPVRPSPHSAGVAVRRAAQRFDAARALHAAGRTAATAGDGPTALDLVGRALTTFEALGATTAAARSRTLLSQLGVGGRGAA